MEKKHIKTQVFSCNETAAITHYPLAKISAFIILTCGVSGSTSVQAEYTDMVSGANVVRTGEVIHSGNRQTVENGGESRDATINQRGVQIVRKNGTTYSTTINKDGLQRLYANGTANFTTINPGGEQEIQLQGLAKNTKINGGAQTIHAAGNATHTVIAQNGTQSIQNEGLAYGTTIESGNLHVAKGGTAAHSTVKGSGSLNVNAGGQLTGKTLILEQGKLNFNAESPEDVLRSDGQLIFQRDDYTLDFGLGGSSLGAVVQNSPGKTLTLTKPSHYHSETRIEQGTVKAAEKHVLSPNSPFATYPKATLDLGAFDQKLIALNNNGTVNFGNSDKSGTTLIVTGDYGSHFGLLQMNATLGDDNSPADKLIVEGNTSGHTYVQVNNLGGSGAKTLNGIELIKVAGKSAGIFSQRGRIVAGSYDYQLQRGAGDNQRNWYLNSRHTYLPRSLPEPDLPPPPPPPVVVFTPSAPQAPIDKPVPAYAPFTPLVTQSVIGEDILSGNTQRVSGGGITYFNSVQSGGRQWIQKDGVSNNTLIQGGTQSIENGGIANNTIITPAGGELKVLAGGVANNAGILGRGYLHIASGGVLTGRTQIKEQGQITFAPSNSQDALQNNGELLFELDQLSTLDFSVGGRGGLTLNSPGNNLSLTTANSYQGLTRVQRGTLIAGGFVQDANNNIIRADRENRFSPDSAHVIEQMGTLHLGGANQTIRLLYNVGTVNFGNSINNQLTITGDYIGDDSLLRMNARLSDDSSAANKLIIGGNTHGKTRVLVNNLGGSGAKTLNGIELITVAGRSDGVFVKNSRIVAGSYEYDLHRGSDDNQSNWYLSSNLTDDNTMAISTMAISGLASEESGLDTPLAPIPIDTDVLTDVVPETNNSGTPHVVVPETNVPEINSGNTPLVIEPSINNVGPLPTTKPEINSITALPGADSDVDTNVMTLRPEAGAYSANLSAANNLFITSLNDRLGETHYTDVHTGERRVTSMWLRNEGGHQRTRESQGQLSSLINRYVVQLGGDIAQWSDNVWGHFRLGMMAGYGNSKSKTESRLSGYSARSSIDGYSTGLYSTWYANNEEKSGLYIDSWVQYSWFNNSISGQELATERYKSKGLTASVESGYTFKLAENMTKNAAYFIQPKAQMTWMGVKADEHKEENGSNISGVGQGNIQTRLGVKAFMNGYSDLDRGNNRIFQPFIEATWLHNTKTFGTTLDSMTVQQSGTTNIGELKLGVEGHISERLGLWGNVGQQIGGQGYSDTAVVLGVKYQF
ncbi:autotransporter protein [Yersinia nurmii]|uniref:Autotransporter protein n=1 Tax=Yersinia nurmii TaxID=685706 RepID=A0ABM9SKK4_9GAMM|nr:autotransporter outer membrane beta-barrel domain-containing protein [Yersinia nurmii]CNE90822.1 autotransporter protein [Yersinia nurmii]